MSASMFRYPGDGSFDILAAETARGGSADCRTLWLIVFFFRFHYAYHEPLIPLFKDDQSCKVFFTLSHRVDGSFDEAIAYSYSQTERDSEYNWMAASS